ncbi:DUF4367 domain-containing protein [Brevibacillus daliensis]|uniref:DUF4367 domain-containing protein n=1 Tax=Brevibacillus daliensis TaxID=2892995 RepID=UPI001E6019AB|nr:DUF4367 domain-containing protein [Brevibacillus daliensis]
MGIEQHKAVGYKISREEIIIDVKNNSTRKNVIEEYFKPSENGELITFNGIKARFEAWATKDKGGILRWVNNGTYIEMDSSKLSKNQMIRFAESLK